MSHREGHGRLRARCFTLVAVLAMHARALAQPGEGVAAGSPSARAAEAHPFHFASSAGCGDTSSFTQAFERRTGTNRLVPGPEGSAIRIELEAQGEHTAASLTIRLEDGRVVERSLEALSCEEALEAIAFVTALALDPDEVRVATVRQASPAPRAPAIAQDEFADAAPPPQAPEETSWAWTVGVLGAAAVGWAPGIVGGFDAEFALRTSARGAWAPGVRLGIGFWSKSESTQGQGTAHFERRYGSLDLCPLGADSGSLTLRFCAQGTAGGVVAEGSDTYAPQRSVRPWVDLGLSLWPEVAFGERLSWTTRLAVGVPLFRDTYQFDERTFYEVPWVVGSLSSGINVRLP